jgi:hypothetical protein
MGKKLRRCAAIGALAALTACGTSLSPLAGTGRPGYTGDGKLAQQARLNQPADVAVTPRGLICVAPATVPCPNLFIVDTGNNALRRVGANDIPGTNHDSVPNGPVDTVLNKLVLLQPQGVVPGPGNTVFVSDTGHNRILRVNPTVSPAVIDVVAGGVGTGPCGNATKLNAPMGLASDGTNLFFAESGAHVVREVFGVAASSGPLPVCSAASPAGAGNPGSITVVAGRLNQPGFKDQVDATLARLNTPRDVDVYNNPGDPSATPTPIPPSTDIFVADTLNNRIRTFSLGGSIDTLAGLTVAGFNGDCGDAKLARLSMPSGVSFVPPIPAFSRASLYFSDTGNNRVRRIDWGFGPAPRIRTAATTYQVPISGPKTLPMALSGPRGLQVHRSVSIVVVGDGVAIADTGNNIVGGIALHLPTETCGIS